MFVIKIVFLWSINVIVNESPTNQVNHVFKLWSCGCCDMYGGCCGVK